MIPAAFDYIVPDSLDGAAASLEQAGDNAKVMAGGHSLLPMMKLRLAQPAVVIDLKRLDALRGIRSEGGALHVGALATHHQVETSGEVKDNCPLLALTAASIGDPQVRNRGTVGGSVVHGDPAADWPAALLALGAELDLTRKDGRRSVAAGDFFLGPLTTAIEPSEILTSVRVPVPGEGARAAYRKVRQKASGFAIVGVAVCLRADGGVCSDIGIGVTGLAGTPFRAAAVEDQLKGKTLTPDLVASASARVADGVTALDDIHASADFRSHLARLHTARAIQDALRKP